MRDRQLRQSATGEAAGVACIVAASALQPESDLTAKFAKVHESGMLGQLPGGTPYAVRFNHTVTSVVAAVYWLLTRLRFWELFGFSIPFGFLGGTSGLIAGATSEPIVGAFLTGLLGIVSGALSLLFSSKSASKKMSRASADVEFLVGPAIVVLCLCALAGLAIGRVYQTQWVNYERKYLETKELNERVNMPLAKLWKQHEYCRSRVKDPRVCDALLVRAE